MLVEANSGVQQEKLKADMNREIASLKVFFSETRAGIPAATRKRKRTCNYCTAKAARNRFSRITRATTARKRTGQTAAAKFAFEETK